MKLRTYQKWVAKLSLQIFQLDVCQLFIGLALYYMTVSFRKERGCQVAHLALCTVPKRPLDL